jgi:hypothetical protein
VRDAFAFLPTGVSMDHSTSVPLETAANDEIVDESESDTDRQSESRVFPLLSTDLPNTTITVSAAAFRPDFRGQAILNITMYIDPGNGQGWTIQKNVSEFRIFDQEIRKGLKKSGATRGISAALSSGGVWTDHSPRGLDPRKVRNYLYNTSFVLKRTPTGDLAEVLGRPIIRQPLS